MPSGRSPCIAWVGLYLTSNSRSVNGMAVLSAGWSSLNASFQRECVSAKHCLRSSRNNSARSCCEELRIGLERSSERTSAHSCCCWRLQYGHLNMRVCFFVLWHQCSAGPVFHLSHLSESPSCRCAPVVFSLPFSSPLFFFVGKHMDCCCAEYRVNVCMTLSACSAWMTIIRNLSDFCFYST